MCAFPYVIAFTPDSMEIRLIVNGNLVHTMSMPKLQLVASKNDIFFASTAPEFFPERPDRLNAEPRSEAPRSPPGSPHSAPPEGAPRPLRLYRIPVQGLGGAQVDAPRQGPAWGADSRLQVPDKMVSRSAASSPVPKAKPAV